MAIKYKTKVNINPETPVSVVSKKKFTAKDRRVLKKELHYKYRTELTEEFFSELNGNPIPSLVEDGIDGVMSPQEIVALYQKRYNKIGPQMKKYIVANVYAKQLALGKAPLANEYMPEVIDLILERVCSGQSLHTICKDPWMPNVNTVIKWFAENPELCARWKTARVARVDALAERMLHEASTPRYSVNAIQRGDGTTEIQTYDSVNRTRIMVDTIKWYMSKMDHETWGNKDANSGDGSNEIKISVVGGLPTTVTEEGKVISDKPQEVQIVVGKKEAEKVEEEAGYFDEEE